jgi:hypothetical protein
MQPSYPTALGCMLVLSGCSLINPTASFRDRADAGQDGGPADAGGAVDGGAGDSGSDASFDAGPCAGGCAEPMPYCDTSSAPRCVECLDNTACDDRDPCTIDRCSLGTCSSTPIQECIAQVVAGLAHTCVRRVSGEVLCWGNNDDGETGDGSATTPTMSPQSVRTADATELSAGPDHTCAVQSDGGVVCWGLNGGRLGNGQSTTSIYPQYAMGISDAVHVAAGQEHTCAVHEDGGVSCWGVGTLVPTRVPGLTGIAEVAVGYGLRCARHNDGRVDCWGSTHVGDGTTERRDSPTRVVDLDDATQVSVGTFACAVRSSGRVACWAQYADGTISTRPAEIAGLVDAVQIDVGAYHACARRTNDEIVCWGDNGTGQLGDGSETGSTVPVNVLNGAGTIEVTTSLGYVTVTGKEGHSCARRRQDAAVICWGWNRYYQLGDGTMTDTGTPVTVVGL